MYVLLLIICVILYAQNIKKWNKCVDMVQNAQEQFQEHLQFKDLLAKYDRDARIPAVASSSNAGANNTTSQRALHHGMVARVRTILINKARSAVELSKRVRKPQRVTDELIHEHHQLEQTDQGWKLAWGIVDRALAGMKCFCGTFHILSPALTTT